MMLLFTLASERCVAMLQHYCLRWKLHIGLDTVLHLVPLNLVNGIKHSRLRLEIMHYVCVTPNNM